jgi:hypothetical protein
LLQVVTGLGSGFEVGDHTFRIGESEKIKTAMPSECLGFEQYLSVHTAAQPALACSWGNAPRSPGHYLGNPRLGQHGLGQEADSIRFFV